MHLSPVVLAYFLALTQTTVLADPGSSRPDHKGLRAAKREAREGKLSRRVPASALDKRELCYGSCAACFGSGNVDCPNDDSYCYNPDIESVSDQCYRDSSSFSDSSYDSPYLEGCNMTGGTDCVSCFGSTYTDCPSTSLLDCYEPAQGSTDLLCDLDLGSGGDSISSLLSSSSLFSNPGVSSLVSSVLASLSADSDPATITGTNTNTKTGVFSSEISTTSQSLPTRTFDSTSQTSGFGGGSAADSTGSSQGQVISDGGDSAAAPALLGRDTAAAMLFATLVTLSLAGVMAWP